MATAAGSAPAESSPAKRVRRSAVTCAVRLSTDQTVRVGANENLIADRRRELAELQTQQQLLSIEDRRGAMIQQRMQFGVSQVQTGYGTISVALGRPDEASRRVYDAAMRQVMALERIQAIVEEIGGKAGMAMRN